MGVTSRMDLISSPEDGRARRADSRPAPGPEMRTSTYFTPMSLALVEASLPASWAANGVPLRAPLNPAVPELALQTVLPSRSVIVMMVLLKDDWIWATPKPISLRTFFFLVFFAFAMNSL